MNATERTLYDLLPAVYRVRDHDLGEPLRALLSVVGDELERIHDDIAHLYDNWFIETCDEWVVPYIGDLLRVRPIHSVSAARVTTRAYVANTLAYRRRKGTVTVLEQLARDTTGWPARAVEFFVRLATTTHVNHVRLDRPATAAIRDAEAAELTSSPFDRFSHTLEVRRIASGRGRYNIPNVGIFVWRVQSGTIGRGGDGVWTDYGTARAIAVGSPGRPYYTFHPAGVDTPLFNPPQVEETITHVAEEENLPVPLRRLALHEDLEGLRRAVQASPPSGPPPEPRFMSEAAPAFRVLVQDAPGVPPVEVRREDIYICEIPDAVDLASPAPLAVAIDPERGRLALAGGRTAHRVFVAWSYGFPGDVGGGPYDRTGSIDEAFRTPDWQIGVSHLETDTTGQLVPTLRDAVTAWNALPPGTTGVIAVMDSLTEHDPASLEIVIPEGSRLLLVAAQWPMEPDVPPRRVAGGWQADGVRPHYAGDLVVRGTAPAGEVDHGRLALNGLLVEGRLTVAPGDLGELSLAHSTLVPASGGLDVAGGNDRLHLRLSHAISGPVVVAAPIAHVSVADSLLSSEGGPASPDTVLAADETSVTIDRSTFLGPVTVEVLDASNSIFTAPVFAARRQVGCVRFSYVPPASSVPRRYRCQPDTEIAARLDEARRDAASRGATLSAADEDTLRRQILARLVPIFESMRYGDPEYGQLGRRCPVEIRQGADDGAEMGVYCFLQQPQREANIRGALAEYLRFGLEAGLFFVTLPRRKGRP